MYKNSTVRNSQIQQILRLLFPGWVLQPAPVRRDTQPGRRAPRNL